LEQPDLLEWVEKELKGYSGSVEVPPYRLISSDVEALDPWSGWKRIIFKDPKALAAVRQPRKLGYPISPIEEHLNTSQGDLLVSLPEEIAVPIMRDTGVIEVGFTVSKAGMAGILAAVRDAVLDWSLKLERAGIRGEGMSFTSEEKQKAQSSSTTINI